MITGGMQGLGAAIAERLRGEYRVVTWDIIDGADVHCDVADYGQVERAADETRAKYGQIDVLVNNAGIFIAGDLITNDPARITDVVKINLLGTINCTRVIAGEMMARGEGQIINICSDAGLEHKATRSVYYASKWGVTGFSKCLHDELHPHGVRVTTVFPSVMDTDLFSKAQYDRDLSKALDPKATADLVAYALATPENVWLPELRINGM
ncbi:SDR family oxidoreductase [Candidatus Saccharibacteria bacterium]|nr:SDR family oxidoreductase [Candidatus Saccharibacteria bacterium]